MWINDNDVQLIGHVDVRVVHASQLQSLRARVVALREAPSNELHQRLRLIEKQVDGVLRAQPDSILLAKEHQITLLNRKMAFLQHKLTLSLEREAQLEDMMRGQEGEVQLREEIIQFKDRSLQNESQRAELFKQEFKRLVYNLQKHKHLLDHLWEGIFKGVNTTMLEKKSVPSYRNRLWQLCNDFQRMLSESQEPTIYEIQRTLQTFLTTLPETKLYSKMRASILLHHTLKDYSRLQQNFALASSMLRDALQQNRPIEDVFAWLATTGVKMIPTAEGIFIEQGEKRICENKGDPITKQLFLALCSSLRALTAKYPKLLLELPPTVKEIIEREVQGHSERLVQIVKYVPQIVRVEDVVRSQSHSQVSFSVSQLMAVLSQQCVSEDVIKGIMGGLGGDMGRMAFDLSAKEGRETVVEKIREVEKIVEKVVEKVVEVAQIVVVEKIVEKIVEVEKIKEVPRVEYVYLDKPYIVIQEIEKVVEVPRVVERIVEVEKIVERVVEIIKEVPKIVEVEVQVERIVEVERICEVEHVVNHLQQEVKEVEVYIEKIVPVQTIVEKIVQVPVYREKIVEKVIHQQSFVEVEKIVQKIVPVVEYRNARETFHQIQTKIQIVEKIVEKIVVVQKIVQRIVEVPQIIQKIIIIYQKQIEILEVEKIREVAIIVEKIKEVERIVEKIVEKNIEVIREVEKIVRIPFIEEKIVIVKEFVEKPVIQKMETTIIKEIILRQPLVVYQTKIMEVEKIINHILQVPKLIRYFEQKIVEVPKTVDRIKEVKVVIQKIIEKMVQVPRVVEVQRIVQKVVVVPRVIQKVVEVQKIVQKIVQKQVQKIVIREVEKIVQFPVIQEKIIELPSQRLVYINVQRVVDRYIDKLVQVPIYQEEIRTAQMIVERTVEVVKEVPKMLQVTRIIPQIVDNIVPVEIYSDRVVPCVMHQPVQLVIEKIVPFEKIETKIETVTQVFEKIVPRKEEVIRIEEIERMVQRIVIEQQIREVEKIVPYYHEVIKQIPTIIEKIVPLQTTVQEIVTAQQIIQKVVQKTIYLTSLMEVQKIKERLIQVPKIIQIQQVIPQLIYVNKYISYIVQKLVEIPIIIQKLKEIEVQKDVIVVQSEEKTALIQVNNTIEKIVYIDKIKEVVRAVNQIEQVLKIVDRYQSAPYPVHTIEERIVEVPLILQKIVQKIIVMPQIVQVLKYIHQVTEQQSLLTTQDDLSYEMRYKQLTTAIRAEIRSLQSALLNTPQAQPLHRFLLALDQHIQVPRVVCVGDSTRSNNMEMSLTVLSDKLITELKRLESTGVPLCLDHDVRVLFMSKDSQLSAANIEEYGERVRKSFAALGPWNEQQQHLLTVYIQERYQMAQMMNSLDASPLQSTLRERDAQIQALKEELLLEKKRDRGEKQIQIKTFDVERIATLEQNMKAQLCKQHQQYEEDAKIQRKVIFALEQQISDLKSNISNSKTKGVTSASINQMSPINEYYFKTPQSNENNLLERFSSVKKTLYPSTVSPQQQK